MSADDPRDVLAAVRRMEDELARVRASAEPIPARDDVARLRQEFEADAAQERAALVEDLEMLLEVMEAGWRRTHAELERLGAEVSQLREVVTDASDALSGAKIEVRLRGEGDDRNGHTTKWERWSAANRPNQRQARQSGRPSP